jgi:hypothetical protein
MPPPPSALSAASRPHFPARTKHHPAFTFGDNAGGSQTLAAAAAAVTDYLGQHATLHGRGAAARGGDVWGGGCP